MSTGRATAQRWTRDGWRAGESPLVIDAGEIVLAAPGEGEPTMVVSQLDIHVAPIPLPDDMFGTPAALTDVELSLHEPAAGDIEWSDEDHGTARVPVLLEWRWSITIAGGTTPLAVIRLPSVDIDVGVSGDGDSVGASVALRARGTLWSWAGLLELTGLELVLGATSS